MLHITVSGFAGEGHSEIISIIEDALKATGKRYIVAKPNQTTVGFQGTPDGIIFEEHTKRPVSFDSTCFDFLIGQTEAAAYEMAQDNGFQVRIVQRNRIPMVVTQDVKDNRVNLRVANNIVVGWYIG